MKGQYCISNGTDLSGTPRINYYKSFPKNQHGGSLKDTRKSPLCPQSRSHSKWQARDLPDRR